jgi:hypothetical protein
VFIVRGQLHNPFLIVACRADVNNRIGERFLGTLCEAFDPKTSVNFHQSHIRIKIITPVHAYAQECAESPPEPDDDLDFSSIEVNSRPKL